MISTLWKHVANALVAVGVARSLECGGGASAEPKASLERHFDRTLTQLESLRRMRLGQPVLPKLEVQHSIS